MGSIIRQAVPEDKTRVAPLVYMAASSHLSLSMYDLMFGCLKKQTLQYLEKLFLAQHRSWFHWSHCLVADVDGDVASTVCGYAEGEAGVSQFIQALGEVTGWKETEFDAFVARVEPMRKVKPDNPLDVWVVEHVATYPEYRHRGLMKPLFDAVLAKGKEKGFARAQITFAIGNAEAQGVYERAGFVPSVELTDPDFEKMFGTPGLRTFIRDL